MAPAGGGPSSAAGGRAALSGRSARQLATHPWAPAGGQPFREELPPTGRRAPLAAGRRWDLLCPRFSSGLAEPARSGREAAHTGRFCSRLRAARGFLPRSVDRNLPPARPGPAAAAASSTKGASSSGTSCVHASRQGWPSPRRLAVNLAIRDGFAPDFAPRDGSCRELWTETCHRGVQRHRAGSGIVNQRRQQQRDVPRPRFSAGLAQPARSGRKAARTGRLRSRGSRRRELPGANCGRKRATEAFSGSGCSRCGSGDPAANPPVIERPAFPGPPACRRRTP